MSKCITTASAQLCVSLSEGVLECILSPEAHKGRLPTISELLNTPLFNINQQLPSRWEPMDNYLSPNTFFVISARFRLKDMLISYLFVFNSISFLQTSKEKLLDKLNFATIFWLFPDPTRRYPRQRKRAWGRPSVRLSRGFSRITSMAENFAS